MLELGIPLSVQAIEPEFNQPVGIQSDRLTLLLAQRGSNSNRRPAIKPWTKPSGGTFPNRPTRPNNRPNLKPWPPPNSNRPGLKPWVPPTGTKPGNTLPPWGPPGTRPPNWKPPANRPPNWRPPVNRPPNDRPIPAWVRPSWRPGWRPGPAGWWPIYRPWINVNVKRWYRAPVITGITLLGTAAVLNLLSDALDNQREYVLIPDTNFQLIYSSVSARGINDVAFDYRVGGTIQAATADCETFRWSSPPRAPRQRPASDATQQLLNAACIVAYGE